MWVKGTILVILLATPVAGCVGVESRQTFKPADQKCREALGVASTLVWDPYQQTCVKSALQEI